MTIVQESAVMSQVAKTTLELFLNGMCLSCHTRIRQLGHLGEMMPLMPQKGKHLAAASASTSSEWLLKQAGAEYRAVMLCSSTGIC